MNSTQETGELPLPPNASLDRALALVEFLRARCPWDAAQTPRSLQRYLLEETHEVIHAINVGDPAALRDELGDLLLNLAFQVVIAEETQAFTREEVVSTLEAKMRRRHPHLYGDGEAEPWEVLKAREKAARGEASRGLLAELPTGAEALLRAEQMQARVATVGFDWPDAQGALEKAREELEEVHHELEQGDAERLDEEIGDLLFSVVNVARLAGVHPSGALARANEKFARRFAALERLAEESGVVLGEADLEALDRLWDEAKRQEQSHS